MNDPKGEILIQVKNLKKHFPIKNKGTLYAVDDVSFEIRRGETLGLVGESGCGKSTVGNLLMRLLSPTSGQILYDQADILKLSPKNAKAYCKKMQIVFQDPFSSLNPQKPVRSILAEPFHIHKLMKNKQELQEKLLEVCQMTGISPDMLNKYPHELDGGKRQVVGIARALSLGPEFIVCDEPVSSLDVSIQAKIINQLIDLQEKLGLAYLFISHDLSVVRHISTRVAVMYLGKVMETADTEELFENPAHPYTKALLSAVLTVDLTKRKARIVLKGDVPSPIDPAPGCRFAPRCWMAQHICSRELPALREVSPGHSVACHFCDDIRKEWEHEDSHRSPAAGI